MKRPVGKILNRSKSTPCGLDFQTFQDDGAGDDGEVRLDFQTFQDDGDGEWHLGEPRVPRPTMKESPPC